MADEELLPGRGYWLKLGDADRHGDGPASPSTRSTSTRSSISRRKTLGAERASASPRSRPTARSCSSLMRSRASSPNKALGGFILIDKLTNATVACGMIHFALRRAHNVHRQHLDVSRETHAAHQGPEARGAVVHRPFRRGQVDHRQSRREEARGARAAHLPARRRQCPPRAQPRPRLHRGRPDREHPPRRRSRAADGRRRPDRPHRLHLAVPGRARTWSGG